MDLQSLTDEELLERIQKGSMDSFKVIYERYKLKIYRYIYHFLNNPELAEDCMQDCFIHLYNKAHLYDPKSKFSSWFYKMAKNLIFDFMRKAKIRNTISLDKEVENEDSLASLHELIESPEFDPSKIAQSNEYIKLMREAIEKLDDEDKELIILCDIEGVSNKEAAEMLNLNQNLVAVRLFRARKQLAKILKIKGVSDNNDK